MNSALSMVKCFWRFKKRLLITAFGCLSAWNILESQQVSPARSAGPAHSLRAIRNDATVELIWKQRLAAVDGSPGERKLVFARICRTISPDISAASDRGVKCGESVGRVGLRRSVAQLAAMAYEKKSSEVTTRFTDRLPENLRQSESLQFAVYTVEAVDDRGQTAGVSNPAPVLLTPTPAVKSLHSQLDSRGIYLIWEDEIRDHPEGVEVDYRLARREKGSGRRINVPYLRAVVHLKEGDRWTAVDPSFDWGKIYTYWVTPVARFRSRNGNVLSEIEGEESSGLDVTARNVFPPAVPERLLALVGGGSGKKFVDLVWAPNIDKDLAGYNIYRRETGGEISLIHRGRTSLLSFQDKDVAEGHAYFYCLSAVDANGNESAKSSEVEAKVP